MPNIKYSVVNQTSLLQFIICHSSQQTFPIKDQIANMFDLVSHMVFVSTTYLCLSQENSHGQCVNE